MSVFYIVGTMALWQLFYKAFGDNLEEYHEILAMPRELIMFRSYFEENGTEQQYLQAEYHPYTFAWCVF